MADQIRTRGPTVRRQISATWTITREFGLGTNTHYYVARNGRVVKVWSDHASSDFRIDHDMPAELAEQLGRAIVAAATWEDDDAR